MVRSDLVTYKKFYYKLLQLYFEAQGQIITFVQNVLNDEFFKTFYDEQRGIKISPESSHTEKIRDSINIDLVTKEFIEELIKEDAHKKYLTKENKIFIEQNLHVLCYDVAQGKNLLGFVKMFLQMKYLSHLETPTIDMLFEKVIEYWKEKNQLQSIFARAKRNLTPTFKTWGSYFWSWLSPSAWREWFFIQSP